ncbi:hypothetical protein FV227_28660, partial [Methylobacterium sp. WL119]|uniref:hypothetical protein n=2 Tax=unclassified Methylobacterium TaxID=2615210 RepID=UPI0011DC64CC
MIDPVKRKYNRDNLILAYKALDSVSPFPFFGTLLGLTREKDIIKNDDDIDLYIDIKHRGNVAPLLTDAGFSVDIDNNPNLTQFFLQATRHIKGTQTYIDIYFYENRDELPWIIDRWNFSGDLNVADSHLY